MALVLSVGTQFVGKDATGHPRSRSPSDCFRPIIGAFVNKMVTARIKFEQYLWLGFPLRTSIHGE